MEMFFTFISKLHSSWYLSAVFLPNVDCFSTGPPDLGAVFTGLALLAMLCGFMAMMAGLRLQSLLLLLLILYCVHLPFCF